MSSKKEQFIWDLTSLYKSDRDPQIKKDLQKVERESFKFINKWKKRKDYLKSPKVLANALKEYEHWLKNYGSSGKYGYYLALRSSQDQTDPEIKAKINKLNDFSVKISNEIQFFLINVGKIPEKEQKKFLQSSYLKNYRRILVRLFRENKHTLSDKEEKIINLKEKTSFSNWVSMVSEFISKEERKVYDDKGKLAIKNFEEIINLTGDKRKKIRKKAAEAVNDILLKHCDTAEVEINTVCENQKVNDQIRKYPRPDSARHSADDIETEIVDSLVSEVSAKFYISKRYYRLKTKLLGLKKMHYYERSVVYGDLKTKYPYEKSIKLVLETLESLDHEFSEILTGYLDNGQFDVFPRKGKVGGAFCAHYSSLEPTYILLNHTNKLKDVLTIAHEVGHGIHNEYMKKKQNELNFGSSMATAEVSSTFFEDFILERILSQISEEEKLVLMMMKLGEDVATIFRQVAFYNFETALHSNFREKGYLTKDALGRLFKKEMQSYMGQASKGCENWWIYVGHFRMFFYVYSYASGQLISKTLQSMVRKDPHFINQVKEFFSTGLSDSPRNTFSKLGLKIEQKKFWDQGLREVEELLLNTEKLAKKLGKI